MEDRDEGGATNEARRVEPGGGWRGWRVAVRSLRMMRDIEGEWESEREKEKKGKSGARGEGESGLTARP